MGKGTETKLTEDQIAALDVIGFDWKLYERSAVVNLMIERGDAVPIAAAPGRLWLTVTSVFVDGLDSSSRIGARIDAINPACTFRDKVSIGDILVTVDGCWVKDLSIGIERSRELVFIRTSRHNWNPEASSTAADDGFFTLVGKLKAYKANDCHLKLRNKEDHSLYTFISNVRNARRDVMLGKGTRYTLTEYRIGALDAIGLNWNTGVKRAFDFTN